MKIHVSSVLFSSPPCQRDRGSNFFFVCMIWFNFNQTIILYWTLSYKHWIKIITLHSFILNYNYFCWLLLLTFLFSLKWKPASLRVGWLCWRRTKACSRWIMVFRRSPFQSETWNAESHVIWGNPFRTEAIIVNTIKWNALEFQIIQLICCIPILKFRACIPSSKNNVEFFPPLISYNPSTPGF